MPHTMPVEFQILIPSMLPVTELRGTIPWFLATRPDLSIWYVFLWAVIGNIIPCFFILWFLPRFTAFVYRYFPNHNWIKKLIDWIYKKSRQKHDKRFYRYGALALIIIVSIPLPGTGGYTGSLLAFLFNIPYWKAMALISLGVVIAGLVVTGISLGGIDLFYALAGN